jgi:hypothetical protein
MAVKDLFESRSHEEVEESFDTWMMVDPPFAGRRAG